MDTTDLDLIVLGAGLRGLRAALTAQRQQPDLRLAAVDAAPLPGGSIRTQRSNGFVCELGAFAFTREEVDPVLALLTHAPRCVDSLVAAGQLVTERGHEPIAVAPTPVSFASGNEELVQACRRQLGNRLMLGRAATTMTAANGRFAVELGGEVPHALTAPRVVVALPPAAAGRLLGTFEPALAEVAARIVPRGGAFVFFGGDNSKAGELLGYGMLAAEGLQSPIAEAIFCTQVFPNRALPGRFLVRCEVGGSGEADAALIEATAAELRRWTATAAEFVFTKVHRFAGCLHNGAYVECTTRLRALPKRVPGLVLA